MTDARSAILGMAALLSMASIASAQTAPAPRFFAGVNVGGQLRETTVDTTFTSEVFQESASVSVTRTIRRGSIFDGHAGVTVRGPLGVAVNVSRFTRNGDGAADASVPDPIFFDRPRTISGVVAGMRHQETWVGALVTWHLPAGRRLSVTFMGGPAVAFVLHEMATAVAVSETAAGPDVRVTLVETDKQLWGYQAGADVVYQLSRVFGVGGFARISRANGHIGPTALELGGLHLGGGARFRF
jgi:hypothetical protein